MADDYTGVSQADASQQAAHHGLSTRFRVLTVSHRGRESGGQKCGRLQRNRFG